MFNSDDSAARILLMACLYSGFQVDEVHTDYLKAKHKDYFTLGFWRSCILNSAVCRDNRRIDTQL